VYCKPLLIKQPGQILQHRYLGHQHRILCRLAHTRRLPVLQLRLKGWQEAFLVRHLGRPVQRYVGSLPDRLPLEKFKS